MIHSQPLAVALARVLLLVWGLAIIAGAITFAIALANATVATDDWPLTSSVATAALVAGMGCVVFALLFARPRDRARSLAIALLGTTLGAMLPQFDALAMGGPSSVELLMLALPVATIVLLTHSRSAAWFRPRFEPLSHRPKAIGVAAVALAALGAFAGLTFANLFLAELVASDVAAIMELHTLAPAIKQLLFVIAPLALVVPLWSGNETARAIAIALSPATIAIGDLTVNVAVDWTYSLPELARLAVVVLIVGALSRTDSRGWCAHGGPPRNGDAPSTATTP